MNPASTPVAASELEAKTVFRLLWRLLPFLFLLYIVAFLDRINVGFTALEMQKQLGLNDRVYGLAAGLFLPDISSSSCPATWCWPGLGRGDGLRSSWWPGG